MRPDSSDSYASHRPSGASSAFRSLTVVWMRGRARRGGRSDINMMSRPIFGVASPMTICVPSAVTTNGYLHIDAVGELFDHAGAVGQLREQVRHA